MPSQCYFSSRFFNSDPKKEKKCVILSLYMYIYIEYNHVTFCVCQTDTASVLSEAIEYIKFLHEQVSVSPITRIPCYHRYLVYFYYLFLFLRIKIYV